MCSLDNKICNGYYCNGKLVPISGFGMAAHGKIRHKCKMCRNYDERKTCDPQKRSIRYKKYREENKEKEVLRHKKYVEEDRSKILIKSRLYSKENSEKIKRKNQIRIQTESGYMGYLIVQLRSKDNKQNRETDIDIDHIRKLIDKQNNRCVYSGVDLTWRAKSGIHQATIDRIDSSKGHIKGNCQLTTIPINSFKSDLNDQDFRRLISLIDTPSSEYHFEELSDLATLKIRNLMSDIGKRHKDICNRNKLTYAPINRGEFRELLDNLRILHGDVCSISKMSLTWEPNKINTASIDRINSSISYESNNVQIVSKYVNFLKGNMPDDIVKDILKDIIDFNRNS